MNSDAAPIISSLAAAPRAAPGLSRIAACFGTLGLLACAAALLGEESRLRLAYGWVWGFSFVWTIALGCLFFVGLHYVTHAVWSCVFKRIAEIFAAPMWQLAVLALPILLFVLWPRILPIYPWADADLVAADHLLHGKHAYLNKPFFILRAAAYFALWIGFANYYVKKSLFQDLNPGDVAGTARLRTVSAPFMILFAFSMTFAALDWIMSLNPYWFSTIFGVYIFSGMVVAALAVITLVAIRLIETGRFPADLIKKDHLYNLGALQFAFTCFWAYIAFSQYMLIWYANIPEESFYIHHRVTGDWAAVSIALAFVRFAVPFLLLLSRRAKMNTRILWWASWLALAGQLLDLYWLIMPELHQAAPALGWQELGPPILMIGLTLGYLSRFLGRRAPLAVGDPLLETSRQFHL